MATTSQESGDLAGAERLLEQALRRGNDARLELQGGCMQPQIRDGDTVLVRRVPRLRPGDVVLARGLDGDLVCHRVLSVSDAGLLLAGDRSADPETHPASSVLGRVIEVHRREAERLLTVGQSHWINAIAARLHLVAFRLRKHMAGRLVHSLRRRFLAMSARSSQSRGQIQGRMQAQGQTPTGGD